MKIFRRISFFAFIAGAFGLMLDLMVQPSSPFSQLLFMFGVVSVFGLLAWPIVFLKEEPELTRVALLILIVCLAILFISIATSPD
jgi:uncharacterized membrane protein